MHVINVHCRQFRASSKVVGSLIDTLASRADALWPNETWSAMKFDRPLAVGADGGHGPVRYQVDFYKPGEAIVFRFKGPKGFNGTHSFDLIPHSSSCELRHTLKMNAGWPAVITWPLIFRPLHDALLEDCLAKAQAQVGEHPTVVPWSSYVKFWRRMFAKSPPPQMLDYAGVVSAQSVE